ncbi:hypothetical protein Acsp01_39200 [Actinoplanes sp. NBRC 101535]|nr:hypothetical protein Acsp01_39200 [Actinoplanes sp. NBRC 101535]
MPDAPVKSSLKTVVMPAGAVGTAASARVTTVIEAAVASIAAIATAARRTVLRGSDMGDSPFSAERALSRKFHAGFASLSIWINTYLFAGRGAVSGENAPGKHEPWTQRPRER